jgi:hypothetical protein
MVMNIPSNSEAGFWGLFDAAAVSTSAGNGVLNRHFLLT